MPTKKARTKAKPVGPHRSAGRPAFEPTALHRETVKVMVAGGIQESIIAGVLRISQRTLQKHFRLEIANGAAEVNVIVIAAHLKRIKAGDMRAIEWWEKSRMGWSEKAPPDDGGANVSMRVVVELVGDPPPITIDHQASLRRDFDKDKFVEFVG